MKILIAVGTLLLLIANCYGTPHSVNVDKSSSDKINLAPYFHYFIDESNKLTIRDITKPGNHLPWKNDQGNSPNFGYNTHPFWITLTLSSTTEHPIDWLLEFAYPLLDDVKIYQFKNNQLIKQWELGDSKPFHQRDIEHRRLLVPLQLDQTDTTLYIRVQTTSSVQLPLNLRNPAKFYADDLMEGMKQSLFYGTLFAMFAYNLFIFASVRHPSYLYYVTYVFIFGLLTSSIDGFGFQLLWPNTPAWNAYAVTVFTPLAVILATTFSIHFLSTKHYNRTCHYVLIGCVSIQCINLLLNLVLPYSALIKPVLIASVISSSSVLVSGILVWRAGNQAARFFNLAWATLLLGIILYSLNKLGVLPRNAFTEHSMQVGQLLEVILLSFALADRINILKKSELKASQKADHAQAEINARNQFFACMTHELRTPLTAILGYSDSAIASELSKSELQENARIIERNSIHLLGLINNTLDLGKIEAGRFELDPLESNFAILVNEIKQCFKVLVDAKGLRFNIDAKGKIPIKAKLDAMRLKQILMNLCSNAIKFTEQGHVTLHIRWKDKAGQYQFIVEDTGKGLTEEQCSQLFDAYVQADKSTARHHGGTGLGLHLSKKLVQLMNGDISVESVLGKGSRFIVNITPIDVDRNSFIDGQKLLAERPHYSEEKITINPLHDNSIDTPIRVLLAEDNEDNQKLIPVYLKKAGANEVTVAKNGKKAVELARAEDFDLILMDIQMPEMDGLAATHFLRKVEYHKPIYALTADYSEKCINEAMASGCNGHLNKPIEFEVILQLIQDLKAEKSKNQKRKADGDSLSVA